MFGLLKVVAVSKSGEIFSTSRKSKVAPEIDYWIHKGFITEGFEVLDGFTVVMYGDTKSVESQTFKTQTEAIDWIDKMEDFLADTAKWIGQYRSFRTDDNESED